MVKKSVTVEVKVTRHGEIQYGDQTVTIADMVDMDRSGMLGPYTIYGKKRAGEFGITPGKYRVTYRLDPKGEYKVRRDGLNDIPVIVWGDENRDYIFVCFIPEKWNRRRVSRTVRRIK